MARFATEKELRFSPRAGLVEDNRYSVDWQIPVGAGGRSDRITPACGGDGAARGAVPHAALRGGDQLVALPAGVDWARRRLAMSFHPAGSTGAAQRPDAV